MTGICHVSPDAMDAAATWLVATPIEQRPRPVIPMLEELFGLSPVAAVAAIREADRLRKEARDASTS